MKNPVDWNLLLNYLRPHRYKVLLLGALLLVGLGLQLIGPQVIKWFIDKATAGESVSTLMRLGLLFVTVAIIGQMMNVLTVYVGDQIAWLVTNQLREDLALHCLNLDVSFHQSHLPGEMIERIDGDVTVLANFFSQFFVRIVGNFLLLIGMLVLLWREDWRVCLAMSLVALVTLLVLHRIRSIAVPSWMAARETSARLFAFLEERLAGIEDLRTSGATVHTLNGLARHLRSNMISERRGTMIGSGTWTTTIALFTLATALGLGLGALLYSQDAITIGGVYLIYAYADMLRRPIEQLTQQIQDFQRATASIHRVKQLLGTASATPDGSGGSIPAGPLSVEFDQVTFAYVDGTPVLPQLSFRVSPGTVLAVVGATGSGKSTIARLILRFYEPNAGVIRIGGTDIREAPLAHLRTGVAIVTQDVQLMRGTIRDNLTLYNPTFLDESIHAAFRELGLWDWFCSLPKGLDTELGTGGAGLSAGQAQLLALTRVFLRNPGLIVFDEATSRMDPATERLVIQAFDRLLAGRTGLIIAHHLATIERADEIMVLERGNVVEMGSRKRLAEEHGSRYNRLLQTGPGEVSA